MVKVMNSGVFKSQDLWDMVEHGYADPDEEARLKENKRMDTNASFFIQKPVHENSVLRIATLNTIRDACNTLERSFKVT